MDTGTRVGKYAIGRKLGAGGFGVIHHARDTELDREVAIKFLRPEHAFKPHVVQRFLQEARAAARIQHPGIVTVYECGIVGGTNTRADGTVFIAMELLSGETLSARLKRERMPLPIALGLVRQMADALASAHDAQIVHRDLKPSNIYLVPDPAIVGGERVKILDFGIAKLVDGFGSNVQTQSMEMLGTPMYMSPEQCKSSARVDARSDIYTLGCILFEMVCGGPPFTGDSGELIAKHQLVAPPHATEIVPQLPNVLDRLVFAMLAKSPDERPQTMLEVATQIDRAIAEPLRHVGVLDSAMSADDVPTVASETRTRSRRPIYLAAGGGAVAIGVAVAIATTGGGVAPTRDASVSMVVAAPEIDAAIAETVVVDAAEVPDDAAVVALPTGPCDEQHLVDEGTNYEGKGDHELALALYERAYECKPGAHVGQLAFMASCNNGDKVAAHRWWQRLTPTAQDRLVVICERAHIDRAALEATPPAKQTCDAIVLTDAGTAAEGRADHLGALTAYEAALKCKPDSHLRQLAFMAACNAGNVPGARRHWKMLSPEAQSRLIHMCLRAHIDQSVLEVDAAAPAPTPVAKCDAGPFVDAGTAAEGRGDHLGALNKYEQALACRPNDAHTIQLGFMAACNGSNVPGARRMWKKMNLESRGRLFQICNRAHISQDVLDQ
ncbi:MAG: serine/threonine-protein kinase [Kofleriaceae bacterium]